MTKSEFSFVAKIWEWDGPQAWHFVSLPVDLADFVKESFGRNARGFKSLRVEVKVSDETWRTSIFPDSKRGTYLLPIKKDIRKRLGVEVGSRVTVGISILP
jgi:hypothetical protein